MYCEYYQANSLRAKTWFVMGCLKNEPNLTFFRTIDNKNSLFECFVTKDYEEHFLDVMNTLAEKGLVFNLVKKENRLLTETVAGEQK